MYQDINNMYIV